jgi:CheY-like chemotaxis protein
LEILCAKPTDVLIADIDMPELDGLTTPAGMGVLEEARLSPPSPLTTRSSF